MHNQKELTTTPAQDRLHQELNHFIADVSAPDAMDSLLHLLTTAGSDLNPEESKSMYSVLYLLNVINRVQKEASYAK